MHDSDITSGIHAYREGILQDPYRPRYHFTIPGDGRPGDPNGCFFADGVHHLMYLYRKDGGPFHWGHAISHDLLHWYQNPDSLVKGKDDEGCFSGGAFVDDDGTAYLSYWIFNDNKQGQVHHAGIGLAMARPPYECWERLPDAIIPSTDWGICDIKGVDGQTLHIGCADPSNIWKKDSVYYIQLGNLCVLNSYGREPESPAMYRGDWTELFSSPNLRQWKYEGRFYQRRQDNSWTDESEDDMCPSFLPLPLSAEGGPASGTMLQLFISHNRGCQYYLGRQEGIRFIPEVHGRMTWKDPAFFAPEAYIDGQGRQIQFSWLRDNLDQDFETYGWSGVYSLPRTLWLRCDHTLGIAPAQELRALRGIERRQPLPPAFANDESSGKREYKLSIDTPDCCEIMLCCKGNGAYRAGITLRFGVEEALIYYNSQEKALVMDLSASANHSFALREAAPLSLSENETLTLDIFIDRSVLEVFAQNRQAISRRMFFDMSNIPSIFSLFEGKVTPLQIQTWEITPTSQY